MKIKVMRGTKTVNVIDDTAAYGIFRGIMTVSEACEAIRRMEHFAVTVQCSEHNFKMVGEDENAKF